MALVSAHRGGAGDDNLMENSLAACERSIALGCNYIEFDVRRSADGHFVVFRDDLLVIDGVEQSIAASAYARLHGADLLRLDDLLELLRGRARARVDLKLRGDEIGVVSHIVDTLGQENVVITTAEDSSVRAILGWSHTHAPGLLVGLSSSAPGGGVRWQDRVESWFPRTRLRRSGANLVVAHRTLARFWLRSYASRRRLPLLVWTVDTPGDLERWMNDPQTWMVTTNYPELALAARRPATP